MNNELDYQIAQMERITIARMERIAEIQANAMKWIVNIASFCIGYWMFSP